MAFPEPGRMLAFPPFQGLIRGMSAKGNVMSRAIAVRRGVVLVMSLCLAACASATPTRWQRPGADGATTAKDESDCHAAAQQEAARLYPYGYNRPDFGPSGALVSQQRDYVDRFDAERRLMGLCMRKKGYHVESAPAR